jgi:hypothetical protein
LQRIVPFRSKKVRAASDAERRGSRKARTKMTRPIHTNRFVVSSTLLLVVATGCAGADDASSDAPISSEDTASSQDELVRRGVWFRHRFPPPRDAGAATGGASSGGTAGTSGSGARGSDDVASCAACSKAQDCCLAVEAGALCTFSQATCESLAPSAREGYLSACAVLLDTVRSVRTSLPDSCR